MIFHEGDSWNCLQLSVGSVFQLKQGEQDLGFLSSYTLNSASVFYWKISNIQMRLWESLRLIL